MSAENQELQNLTEELKISKASVAILSLASKCNEDSSATNENNELHPIHLKFILKEILPKGKFVRKNVKLTHPICSKHFREALLVLKKPFLSQHNVNKTDIEIASKSHVDLLKNELSTRSPEMEFVENVMDYETLKSEYKEFKNARKAPSLIICEDGLVPGVRTLLNSHCQIVGIETTVSKKTFCAHTPTY